MRKSIHALAALVLCAPLFAQNINQTVQVTNDYVTRFADFQKQGGTLSIPDSLYRFDYHFDYSVFDTPYKGSYEFSPYRVRVTPQARLYDGSKFFLRAGAGYSFHPQFEMAWQLLEEKDFTIGVFADLGGYMGNCYSHASQDVYQGRDLTGHVVINGQAIRPATRLSYQIGYDGIYVNQEGGFRSGFSSGFVTGRIQSRERPENHLFYDFDLRLRHSGEKLPESAGLYNSHESNLYVGVSAGPVLQEKYRILLDGIFEMEALGVYQTMFRNGSNVNFARLRPHVDFLLGPVRVDAGVRLDWTEFDNSTQKAFTIAPDVMARMAVLDADLDLYAGISGGQVMEGHFTLKEINHFVPRPYAGATISRERLRVRAGMEGPWKSGLQYAFEAGYVSYSHKPLPSLRNITFVDYQSAYANATLGWTSERLTLDGTLSYAYLVMPEGVNAFAPAAFTADVRGTYNWDRKFFVGAFVEATSSRRSLSAGTDPIRGYANVGLNAEYRINRNLGVWLEGGNLLGMAIERMPGFVEKSPYVTLGVTLKL